MSRDFFASGSFHKSVSPQPQSIALRPFRIFSKIRGDIRSSGFATGVNDTGGKWKKSSIRKILIILFGHLWEVEETYILIFAFKFTFRYLQPDIVPIICHRCGEMVAKFAAGVVDTGGKFPAGVVDTGGNSKFATCVVDTGGAP